MDPNLKIIIHIFFTFSDKKTLLERVDKNFEDATELVSKSQPLQTSLVSTIFMHNLSQDFKYLKTLIIAV